MIELRFTGMCEGCQHADLKLVEENSYADFQRYKEWYAKCIHESACLAMKDKTVSREKQKYKLYGFQPSEDKPWKEKVHLPSGNVAQKE